jgi:hypothetical protein
MPCLTGNVRDLFVLGLRFRLV